MSPVPTTFRGEVVDEDHDLLAEVFDAAVSNGGGTILAAGVLTVSRIYVPRNMLVTNIIAQVTTAGATLTAGQCFAGIYDDTGARVGVTADQSTPWVSTGVKVMALTAPVNLQGGRYYYVAFVSNGTTQPTFLRGANVAAITAGQAAPFRFGTVLTGQTSLPATITPSAVAAATHATWVGLS
jgi:hypothetical protein